jgi:hypothetical protein
MKIAIVCLLVISVGVIQGFRSSPTSNDSEKSAETKTDPFDVILKMIKMWLCAEKKNQSENSDDLFQMIMDLARIFLCEENKSSN